MIRQAVLSAALLAAPALVASPAFAQSAGQPVQKPVVTALPAPAEGGSATTPASAPAATKASGMSSDFGCGWSSAKAYPTS